jgi:hypothetical protein
VGRKKLLLPTGPLRRFRLPEHGVQSRSLITEGQLKRSVLGAIGFILFTLLLYWLGSSATWQEQLRHFIGVSSPAPAGAMSRREVAVAPE